MPFSKWSVEPVFIGRNPIPPDKKAINELDAAANNQLVGAIHQLASLVRLSDRMFAELTDECKQLLERTARLKKKVDSCQLAVGKLNAKQVKVPVGDLNTFIKIESHFKSKDPTPTNQLISKVPTPPGAGQNLFTPSTRPNCIRDAYNSAAQTPVHLIRAIDAYRDDGRLGSRLFICQPVFADAKKRVNFIDIETRRPASLVLARELPREVIISRAKTPLCNKHNVVLDKDKDDHQTNRQKNKNHHQLALTNGGSNRNATSDGELSDSTGQPIYALPSPEEQMQLISGEFPAKYVPIDVTGVGFTRMSSMRRSLIHTDFLIRRKKSPSKGKRARRRNTICEPSANELDKRRSRLSRRRSAGSLEFVHTSVQTEDNDREIYKSGKVLTLRKSDSNNNHKMVKADVHHHYETRSLEDLIDDDGNQVEQRSVGVGDDGSIDSDRPTTRSRLNDRCKDVSYVPSFAVKMRENCPAKATGDDGRSSSGNWSASSSTHASVDLEQVTGRHGDGHQHNKKDLTDDSRSNSSIGKDSVISDSNTPVPEHDDRHSPNHTNGYSSDTSGFNGSSSQRAATSKSAAGEEVTIRGAASSLAKNKVQYANRDSESWLKYFDQDSSDNQTNNSNTPTVTTPTESESGQTQTSNQATAPTDDSRRSSLSTNGQQSTPADDGEEVESVYSVDTDGYYTSMHTDSGLFRIPVKLMITPNSSFRVKGKRDSITSVTTVGDLSINSILSKTETESSTSTLTGTSRNSSRIKLPPPPPPPRVSSMLTRLRKAQQRANRHSMESNKSNTSNNSSGNSNGRADSTSLASTSSRSSHSPSPGRTNSESDNSYRRHLQLKTNIDSSMYPSMCAVTDNSEDGKSGDSSSTDGSHRATPSSKFLKSSYKALRINKLFGLGSKDSGRNTPVNTPPSQSTTPHIATIRRPQSPFRFSMYTENTRRRLLAQKANVNDGTNDMANVVRANAISSFTSDPDPEDLKSAEESPDAEAGWSRTSSSPTQLKAGCAEMSDQNQQPAPSTKPAETAATTTKGSFTSPTQQQKQVPFTMLYPVSRQVSPPSPTRLCQTPSSNQQSQAARPNTLSLSTSSSGNSHHRQLNGTPSPATAVNVRPMAGARVMLNAAGQVIYASNSLGRRRDGHPMNYVQQLEQIQEPTKMEARSRNATLPLASKQGSSPLSPVNRSGALARVHQNGFLESVNQHLMTSPPSAGDRNRMTPVNGHTNWSSSGKSAPSSRCTTPVSGLRSFTPGAPRSGGTFFQVTGALKPNEEGKMLESDLNDMANNNQTKQSPGAITPTVNGNVVKSPNNPYEISPSSPSFIRNGKSRLSTNDLLILIHNSKKKLNIKTDPEIITSPSSPPSSRPETNGKVTPNSVANNKSPTSPKSHPTTPSRPSAPMMVQTPERRSWSGTENGNVNGQIMNQPGYRRSLATDRLGPPKPTNINDFKRLLLQTRPSNFSDRLSASEMLRANAKRPLTPLINSPSGPVNSMTSPVSRTTPKPEDVSPPQIITSSINSNSNVVKPKIIRSTSGRMPYRREAYPPILEEKEEDRQTANNHQQLQQVKSQVNRSQPNVRLSPVAAANNYNRAVANPNSTSTWV